jgi:hypothetical protein
MPWTYFCNKLAQSTQQNFSYQRHKRIIKRSCASLVFFSMFLQEISPVLAMQDDKDKFNIPIHKKEGSPQVSKEESNENAPRQILTSVRDLVGYPFFSPEHIDYIRLINIRYLVDNKNNFTLSTYYVILVGKSMVCMFSNVLFEIVPNMLCLYGLYLLIFIKVFLFQLFQRSFELLCRSALTFFRRSSRNTC